MAADKTKLVFNAITGNFDMVQDVSGLANTSDLSAYIPLTQKGAASGVATLDSFGKLTASQVSSIAITDTYVVASQAAMLALSAAETGDIAVRTDLNKTFILKGTSFSTLADWQELLTPTDAVQSVNGLTGTVTLTTTNIAEGTNLYYTAARFNTAFTAKSTTDLAEGTNLYYTNARVASLVTPTVDYVNRQLKQSTFVAASWDSLGLDFYDSANTANRRITGLSSTDYYTGTDLNTRQLSARAFGIAAAGTTTLNITTSKFYNIKYSAVRNTGGNDGKVGTLHIAKENATSNTNASINDVGASTNVSMNGLTFSINASGNLLITNSTAFIVDIKFAITQL